VVLMIGIRAIGKGRNSVSDLRLVRLTECWNSNIVALFMCFVNGTVTVYRDDADTQRD